MTSDEIKTKVAAYRLEMQQAYFNMTQLKEICAHDYGPWEHAYEYGQCPDCEGKSVDCDRCKGKRKIDEIYDARECKICTGFDFHEHAKGVDCRA